MDHELSPGAYRAVEFDEETGNTLLGIVQLSSDGRLKALGIEEGCEEALAEVVDYMNAKDNLRIEVAPPPGARPHQIFKQEVDRGTPLFLQALADYLKKYYGITLEPSQPGDLPAGMGPLEDYRDDPYRPLPNTPPQLLPDLAPPPPPEPEETLG